jgi:hypothetical protein
MLLAIFNRHLTKLCCPKHFLPEAKSQLLIILNTQIVDLFNAGNLDSFISIITMNTFLLSAILAIIHAFSFWPYESLPLYC